MSNKINLRKKHFLQLGFGPSFAYSLMIIKNWNSTFNEISFEIKLYYMFFLPNLLWFLLLFIAYKLNLPSGLDIKGKNLTSPSFKIISIILLIMGLIIMPFLVILIQVYFW